MRIIRFVLALPAAVLGMLVVAPVVLVGLPFAIVAALTRGISRVLEPRVTPWGELIEFDPTFGWRPREHLNTHHLADDVFHVTTDAHGWRGKASITESRLVVFGDSFAWGYGIDDAHFFADLVPTVGVKAVGTVGYNMVQELLWMEQLSDQLAGKIVVWFIYYANDLCENLLADMCGYRTPFVRELNGTGDWEIVRTHLSPAKWPFTPELRTGRRRYHAELAQLCAPTTLLSQRAYPACAYLIRQGRDLCLRVGARLVVMGIADKTQLSEDGIRFLRVQGTVPESLDVDFPDQRIGAICDGLGVSFVPIKAHLDVHHYKAHDCHWNRAGHRRVAELLRGLCQEDMAARSATRVGEAKSPAPPRGSTSA